MGGRCRQWLVRGVLLSLGGGDGRAQAQAYFAQAAQQGHRQARFNLANGLRLAALSGAAPDPAGLAQALQTYEQAADQGDPLAMYMLARAHWCAEGCAHDAEQALQAYTRAADLGDAGAQFCLGYMYANCQGVAQDYALAARWYLAAAGAPADPVSAPVAQTLATPQTQEVGLTADVQG